MDHFIGGSILLMVTAVLIVLIIITYQQSSKHKHSKWNRQFSLVLWLDLAFLLTEIVIWIFAGTPGKFYRGLLLLPNYLGLFLGITSAVAFFVYIAMSIPVSEKSERIIKRTAVAVIVAHTAIVAILQIRGLIFFLDESNNYILGIYYYLPIKFTGITLLSLAILVLFHSKVLGAKKTLIFVSYSLIILVGSLVSLFWGEYPIAYVTEALSLLMAFVSIQIQRWDYAGGKTKRNQGSIECSKGA